MKTCPLGTGISDYLFRHPTGTRSACSHLHRMRCVLVARPARSKCSGGCSAKANRNTARALMLNLSAEPLVLPGQALSWSTALEVRGTVCLLHAALLIPAQADATGYGRVIRSRADHQITELAVHSWDLVRATGAPVTLDPSLAEYALAWSQTMLRPQFRGPGLAFGAEVTVPEDAPAYDRLAGWFGRDPGWTSPVV